MEKEIEPPPTYDEASCKAHLTTQEEWLAPPPHYADICAADSRAHEADDSSINQTNDFSFNEIDDSSIYERFQDEEGVFEPSSIPPSSNFLPSRPTIDNLPALTDGDLRKACYDYISQHCCYGSRFIRDMILTDIQNSCSFHYILESLGEKRASRWTFEAYHGQPIDGPENGPVPRGWDIPVSRPTVFSDSRTCQEFPHTAYVKQCILCVGNGKMRCGACHGHGKRPCWKCGGSGRIRVNDSYRTCVPCSGIGLITCFRCHGRGMVTCKICGGHCKLKHYKELIVMWTIHQDNFITDSWNLPEELIAKEVDGRPVFSEQDEEVSPMDDAPDPSVNIVSKLLLNSHNTSFENELIIQQRHVLLAVPLTKVNWMWRNKRGEFYVYGFQKKVYFEEYPQPHCCCTIL